MDQTKPQHSGWILTAAILASGLGFFMGSAVNVVLPTIQEHWDLELSVVQWVANGYALTLSSLILLSGAMGDLFGVRRVFLSGILTFAGGGLLCAVAPSPSLLIGARAVQGGGAAMMVPGSLAIIQRLFPQEERGRVIGLWAGISGAIAALGPFFGGALAELNWRLVFWFVVPVGLLAAVVTLRYVPYLKDEEERSVDWLGAATILVALGGVSYGLVRIPDVGLTAVTGGALILGLFGAAAFLPVERGARTPIVPTAMIDRTVGVANIVTVLLYFAFQGTFFLLSFIFQQLIGYSASFTGIAFLPATLMIAVFASSSGKLTDRKGPRLQLLLGPLILGSALLVMLIGLERSSFLYFWLPVVLLFGAGMVLIVPAVTKAALLVEERYSGAASGLNNAAARTAGLLAITLLGAALNTAYHLALPRLLPEGLSESARLAVMEEAGRLLAAGVPQSVPETMREAVRTAQESAFMLGSRLALAISAAAAFVSALFVALLFPRRRR